MTRLQQLHLADERFTVEIRSVRSLRLEHGVPLLICIIIQISIIVITYYYCISLFILLI